EMSSEQPEKSPAPRGAVQASPHPVIAQQPDGTKIALYLRGDERLNWYTDLNGYAVVQKADGHYVYAVVDVHGKLTATDLRVGKADPTAESIKKRVIPQPKSAETQDADPMGGSTAASPGVDPMADPTAEGVKQREIPQPKSAETQDA